VYAGRDATAYEDRGALPRAYLVGATTRMPDRHALATIARGGLDPRKRALVPPDAPAVSGPARPFTPLRTRRIDPAHWRIEVPPGAGGWLVLANAFHDNWRARVDGRETKLYPTDYAAMGLPLPRGARTVDVELDRDDVDAGALVSGLSLLATLGLGLTALLHAHRRRRAPG
jgi:hypothetical protein